MRPSRAFPLAANGRHGHRAKGDGAIANAGARMKSPFLDHRVEKLSASDPAGERFRPSRSLIADAYARGANNWAEPACVIFGRG
jgi:hypothetical protein